MELEGLRALFQFGESRVSSIVLHKVFLENLGSCRIISGIVQKVEGNLVVLEEMAGSTWGTLVM